MESFVLKVHRIFVSAGMEDAKATELAEVLGEQVNTRVSKDDDLARKSDLLLLHKDLENVVSQIRTLQWLYAGVGIPILIAIFLEFFQ